MDLSEILSGSDDLGVDNVGQNATVITALPLLRIGFQRRTIPQLHEGGVAPSLKGFSSNLMTGL